MSPEGPPSVDGSDEGDDRPIALLTASGIEPSPGFLSRLRRRVERRLLAAEIFSLTWQTPWIFLKELIEMFSELLSSGKDKGGSQ